ncbi:MAG: ketopantoate reductase family protein [Spirochaetes bacterium]|uniref:2-dehydropantoate 2-reductase n=1 Tax=Candidatus Ornithospirochaeta stercoravium TaxID=2840897 RepID=A0A9D9NCF7_9SPIO|nr:ketopantoate reductase family protein [Candidatus Ornithospirochaeta stercoravium]
MKVRIIGAGAVGAVVGWKLYKHADLAFIVDEERKERYSGGLAVNGEVIDFRFLTPSEADTADLLIFAVKNFSLEDAADEASPFVGENTVILSLLNGIEAEEKLSERFGAEKVLYGFITDLSSVHDGTETTCFSGGGNIVFSEKDNTRSARVEEIAALFDEAGQRYTIPENIMHEKWWKFMLNTCFNTLSAILIADYAAISSNSDFIRAVRLEAREVQTVAKKEGVIITQDDIEEMIRRVTALQDHGKTSMLQDVLSHRETENRYFAGAVSRLGKKHSVETPISDFLSILLEAKRRVLSV